MFRKFNTLALVIAVLLGLVPLSVVAAQTPPATTPTVSQPAATSVPAASVNLYALTTNNRLLRFTGGAPGTGQGDVAISGLQANENLLGIDFRPATGQLFGLGSTSRLYTIDANSGAATAVGTGVFTTTLSGTEFGFDFNPVVDRIRVVSDNGQNLRLNPNNGAIAAIDGTLTYTSTDTNAGQNPIVVASAYTNNFPGPPSTTLFNIDSNRDVLVTQNPPNSGTLNTVGALGVNVENTAGFDIVGANTAFAALTVGGTTGLYTINLGTGAATLVGPISGNVAIRGLTAALSAAAATVTPPPATGTVTLTAVSTPGTPAVAPTGTVDATAPAGSPTTAATTTTAPMATATTVAFPTLAPPTAAPPVQVVSTDTPIAIGMPRTGQADGLPLIVIVMLGLSVAAIGWFASRRMARSSR